MLARRSGWGGAMAGANGSLDRERCVRYGMFARGLGFAIAVAATLSLAPGSVRAQTTSGDAAAARRDESPARPSSGREAGRKHAWSTAEEPYIGRGAPQWRYFAEFRARNAASYGHMYVMFGEVNARHEIIKSEIAGIFPAGDRRDCENCSIYYWTIGHVLPVPSEIGASDGDLEEQYVLARFRVWLDADQYKRLGAYIRERKASKGPWNALFANCVLFGRDVASFLDLKLPPTAALGLVYPQGMVEALREANGPSHEQLPLKDAPGSLPGDTKPKEANHRSEGKAEASAIH